MVDMEKIVSLSNRNPYVCEASESEPPSTTTPRGVQNNSGESLCGSITMLVQEQEWAEREPDLVCNAERTESVSEYRQLTRA